MNVTDSSLVVFRPAGNLLIDFVKPSETNEQAVARLASHGDGLVIMTLAEAMERHEAAAKTAPVEITERKFTEMLCVLPPVRWHNDGATESFKMSERKTGFITGIYVRLGDRYFSFDDDITLPHEECCNRVRESESFKPPARDIDTDTPER